MLGVFEVKKEVRVETSSVCHGVDAADLGGLWRRQQQRPCSASTSNPHYYPARHCHCARGTIQPFVAFVSGAPGSSVMWTTSAGTIDQSGNYTAPSSIPQGGTAMVTATITGSPSAAASATVAITLQPVTLSIAPSTATLKAGFSAVYTANVGGTTNTSVSWSIADLPGDSTYPGSMVGPTYTAPAPVFTPDSFTVSAVSNADPTKTASASVNVIPLENQELQTSPIKLGASGINANTGDCCSGTLGSLLVDQKGKHYILSNNHVLGRVGHAAQGEAIVQPGYVDTLCDFTLPKTVANFSVAPPITRRTWMLPLHRLSRVRSMIKGRLSD